jgi:hypothetical protein
MAAKSPEFAWALPRILRCRCNGSAASMADYVVHDRHWPNLLSHRLDRDAGRAIVADGPGRSAASDESVAVFDLSWLPQTCLPAKWNVTKSKAAMRISFITFRVLGFPWFSCTHFRRIMNSGYLRLGLLPAIALSCQIYADTEILGLAKAQPPWKSTPPTWPG